MSVDQVIGRFCQMSHNKYNSFVYEKSAGRKAFQWVLVVYEWLALSANPHFLIILHASDWQIPHRVHY